MVGPAVFSRTISVARYMESKKNMPAPSHSDTLGSGEVDALPRYNEVLFSTNGCPGDKRMGVSNEKNGQVEIWQNWVLYIVTCLHRFFISHLS